MHWPAPSHTVSEQTYGGPLAAVRGMLDRPLASYYLLLASVGLLLTIGLVMVFSATSVEDYAENGNAFASAGKQLVSASVGLVAFWICQRLPARTYRAMSGAGFAACLVLVLLIDVLGFLASIRTRPGEVPAPLRMGPVSADQLWLYAGPVQLQPSELAKLGLVVWGADVLVRKGRAIGQWRELATPLFPVAALLFVLVGYNDLGTMICLLVLFVGLLWAAGVRLRVFAGLAAVVLTGVTLLVLLPGKKGYRVERLDTFVDPAHAGAQGPAYQFFRGLYAIANGGWFGVGLGEGRTKWGRLPNAHNDSIFALIGEELGVVGCLVVLTLFAVLAYTGLRIARRVNDPFRRLVAAGITTWLVGQATINIGGVVGLLPITGLPLPFISEGGSALVVALAAAGILTSFARAEPDAARALHARPPRRWVRLLWAPLPPLPRAKGDPGVARSAATAGGAATERAAAEGASAGRVAAGRASAERSG
jgi:cell division protein FtsW